MRQFKQGALATGVSMGLLLAAAAAGAAVVPVGTAVTGGSGTVLGLDAGFAAVAGTETTALTDIELEFLSSDSAVGFDFFSDGKLVVYENTGTGALSGPFSFTFSFAGLAEDITSFAALDVTGLANGSTYSFQVVDAQTVKLSFEDLQFRTAFGSFSAQIGTTPAASVPAPTTLALVAGGLALLAGVRRTRQAARS